MLCLKDDYKVFKNKSHNPLPLSDVLDPIFLPRRMSSGFGLRPILGVGGKDASMKGMESSS